MNKDRLWKQVQAELQLVLSETNYKLFFSNTFLAETTQNPDCLTLVLAVPNSYVKEKISRHYEKKIIEIIGRLVNNKVKIKVVVSAVLNKKPTSYGPLFSQKKEEKQNEQNLQKILQKTKLNPFFSFDNFAVSSSNEMAYAAAKAVVRTPGKAYNPLFFYGGVGVGKTHLMQAIAQQALANNQSLKVLYCTGEEFTNEIIDAIQTKNTSFFRQKYRSMSILLIDDIQFIAGKNTVQEEFFHTFNSILQGGGQIMLTSDKPPSEIQKLEERLASRFEAGLIVDIQEPNFELRTAILLIKAKMLALPIPMDAAQLIASKITSTRQLEGTLIKIKAYVQAHNEPITPDLVAGILKLESQSSSNHKQTRNPREIISQVAHYFNLKVSQLKGKDRHKNIVLSRQVAMFLLRVDAGYSLVEVGSFFGGRDHTTVMHGVDKIKKLLASSEEIRFNIGVLRRIIF